jgi:hypothetical protein
LTQKQKKLRIFDLWKKNIKFIWMTLGHQ